MSIVKLAGIMALAAASVAIDATSQDRSRSGRPLDERGRDNLVAFARLCGYVRHFHPSDAAAATDWHAFVVEGVDAVEDVEGASELAAVLQQLFDPISNVRVIVSGEDLSFEEPAPPPGAHVIAWEHVGYGQPEPRGPYRSERVRPYDIELGRIDRDAAPGVAFPDPSKPYRAELGAGVSAFVPLALYADDAGTLPRRAIPEALHDELSADDRAVRLAGVVLVWNVLQHFYPYLDTLELDWAAELPRLLDEAAEDANRAEFERTLRSLSARLRDGHAAVYPRPEFRAVLPIRWAWVEDRLVVTEVSRDDPYLAVEVDPGDVVLEIDGRPVSERFADVWRELAGSTPQWDHHVACMRLLVSTEMAQGELLLRTPGEDVDRRVPIGYWPPRERGAPRDRPDPVEELRPGIWYVDLTRVDDDAFAAAKSDLAKARGIVFDLRGYPRLTHAFLQHLIDAPVRSPRWHVPVTIYPDRRDVMVDESFWELQPAKPRFAAKLAFLADGTALSAAETYLSIVSDYDIAPIVGQATGGTNGNGNVVQLPGGLMFGFTGMQVFRRDGSVHHGVGVLPDENVPRTIAGITAGRDEQLERAIEIVSGPR